MLALKCFCLLFVKKGLLDRFSPAQSPVSICTFGIIYVFMHVCFLFFLRVVVEQRGY